MAPTTKEGQRAELHRTIWRIANDLRGSVDGWDFKSYVIGMLFYRFISENAYNIAVSSYVEQDDTREIVAITALNVEIARIVAHQSELHTAINAIVVDLEGVES